MTTELLARGAVAVQVGTDLGFYVTPDEVDGVALAAQQPAIEGRFADAVDVIADALVDAHDAAPPEPGATPTPRPSPTPETVRTPDFVGLTRGEAQALANEQDLRLRTLFQQTDDCDTRHGPRASELSCPCLNTKARLMAAAAGCKLNQRARSSDG